MVPTQALCTMAELSIENTPTKPPPSTEGLEEGGVPGEERPGWKAMPYIVGNEAFERLGTFGLTANFTVYLRRVFNMSQVQAANTLNNWNAAGSLTPLVGAFISDSYTGKFPMLVLGSFGAFLGMIIVTLTASVPQLHPAQCSEVQQQVDVGRCDRYTPMQLAVLLSGLVFLSIGTGGIRPCCIPFGVDQFDATTVEGRKGIRSYFNVFYALSTIAVMLSSTIVIYIQEQNWALGFGIPSLLMLCAIVLLFAGTRVYVYVKPGGSLFSSVAQVFVAAVKKRRLQVPAIPEVVDGVFYDPPLKINIVTKLTLKKEFSWLNKAAMIVPNDLNPNGTPTNSWRLCSVQQVEEVKCLMRTITISLPSIIVFVATTQQGIFSVFQALKMDRRILHFQVPAGSLSIVSYIIVAVWIPVYDRILVPTLEKLTGHEGGVTLLQRLGVGIIFSIGSLAVAGLVEQRRRGLALRHPSPDGVSPMSVLWLVPQLVLSGFYDAFFLIGQIEFFNKQFPDEMRSIANAMPPLIYAVANMVATLLVNVVHNVTGGGGRKDWLTDNINEGRIDNFYFLLTGLLVVNFGVFMFISKRYRYKGT